jgi:predicted metal-binding membrane protein
VSTVAIGNRPRGHVLSRITWARWHHPEWSLGFVVLASWAMLVLLHPGGWFRLGGHAMDATGSTGMPGMMPEMPGMPGMPAMASAVSGSGMGWATRQGDWLLMAVAMMLPSALPMVRHVELNTRWSRRQRSGALFAGSTLAVWALFGLVVVSLTGWMPAAQQDVRPLVGALVLAAAWELTPAKRRSLRACHRTSPLPPNGWKADTACIRSGLRYGMACVGACWALMLCMAIAGHAGLSLMFVLTIIVVAEEVLMIGTRLGGRAALLLVATAFAVAMTA